MQKYTHFENLIFSFCSRHKVPMIQPDANLHYVLFVDNVEVRCYSNGSDIYLESELPESPDLSRDSGQQYKQIMQQSLLDCFSSRSVVSLNERDRLTIFQKLSFEECELQEFEASIESLANQVEAANEAILC